MDPIISTDRAVTDSERTSDSPLEAVAAMLLARVGPLADAADDAAAGIEQDRRELEAGEGGSGIDPADGVIESVVERVARIAADCRELTGLLDRFRSLSSEASGTEDVGAADAETVGANDVEAEPVPIESAKPAPPEPFEPQVVDRLEDGHGGDERGASASAPFSPEPAAVSEGVRLLATQMSVAGASTAEIARRLEEDFGVEDADAIVVELFGPAGGGPA